MKKFTFNQLFAGFKFMNNGTGFEMEVVSVTKTTATVKKDGSINKIHLTKQMFDSLVKQGRYSRIKYVMVTHEFETPMYIGEGITIESQKKDAQLWDYEDTISSAKLPYHKAVTGWDGLHFEKV